MQLIYRGYSYEAYRRNSYKVQPSTQLGSDSKNSSKVKLIYRGVKIDYIPPPVNIFEEDTTDWDSVTLIYRGNTYERKVRPLKSYQKPIPLTNVGNEKKSLELSQSIKNNR